MGWDDGIALHDWCESNYARSATVAEWHNTFTNLSYVVVGLATIALPRGGGFARLRACGAMLCCIGLGSMWFHGTLSRAGQAADELAILWWEIAVLCCVFEDALRARPARTGGAIAALFVVENVAYAFMDAYPVLGWAAYHPLHSCVDVVIVWSLIQQARGSPAVVRWALRGVACIAGAFVFWAMDFWGCAWSRPYHLHAYGWHLGSCAAIGCLHVALAVQACRARKRESLRLAFGPWSFVYPIEAGTTTTVPAKATGGGKTSHAKGGGGRRRGKSPAPTAGGAPSAAAAEILGVFVRAPALEAPDCSAALRRAHPCFGRAAVARALVRADGLAASLEWHRTARAAEEMKGDLGQRAVLLQSVAHLGELHARFAHVDPARGAQFGENLLVGPELNRHSLAVGDVLTVGGGRSPLVLQVTSPRRPCSKVDTKHGKDFGPAGVRRYCAGTGLAGWFCRVLVEGDVRRGDALRVTKRGHEAWTLARVSQLLYGHVLAIKKLGGFNAANNGTEEELRELSRIEELAGCEWKHEAEALLPKRTCAVM